jgi:hypothetical protein
MGGFQVGKLCQLSDVCFSLKKDQELGFFRLHLMSAGTIALLLSMVC